MNAPATLSPRSLATATFTEDQRALLKRTICKGASDDEFSLFCGVCERTGLDPFAKQIHAVFRPTKNEAGVKVRTMSIQVGIDGFRVIAQRTGQYEGQVGPWWCGPDGEWKDAWLAKEQPAAARIGVMRSGFREPLFAVATWESYKQGYGEQLAPKWQSMGDVMLAKCAEALALRRAFPQELGGLHTDDEMAQAEREEGAEASKERNDRILAAGAAAIERGREAVAIEAPPAVSLRERALVQLDTIRKAARAPQPWHAKAAQQIPMADERVLDEFERGVLAQEQAAREEAGEAVLEVGEPERSAIRVFVWSRLNELALINKAAHDYHKNQHGSDYVGLDRAVRAAIVAERTKLGSSIPAPTGGGTAPRHNTGADAVTSWNQTAAGKAIAASEMSEGIVIVGVDEGGSVG